MTLLQIQPIPHRETADLTQTMSSSTEEASDSGITRDGFLFAHKATTVQYDHKSGHGVDAAWAFLSRHQVATAAGGEDAAAAATSEDKAAVCMKTLRRKIDWHIVPLMFCCYMLQFLDKTILNVGRRQKA